jgi:hypothetical protein
LERRPVSNLPAVVAPDRVVVLLLAERIHEHADGFLQLLADLFPNLRRRSKTLGVDRRALHAGGRADQIHVAFQRRQTQ